MRCQKEVSVLGKKKVKQYEESMANEQSQNGRGEYQIDAVTYAKGGYSKCVHMRTKGRGVEESVIRNVCTKWMAPDKRCGIFFIYYSCQVH